MCLVFTEPDQNGTYLECEVKGADVRVCQHLRLWFVQVLSDPQKKRIYDQFGEDGLKGGVPDGSRGGGGGGAGHAFNFQPRNAEDIFAEVCKALQCCLSSLSLSLSLSLSWVLLLEM